MSASSTQPLRPPILNSFEPSTVSDSLLQRIAAGDGQAVRECLDRYSKLVWSLARRWSDDAGEAEDAMQEIFVELWRSAARFDPGKASETAFITMIARRRLIDRRRRQSRRPAMQALPESIDVADDAEHDPAERASDVDAARRAFSRLKPDQKRVLELSIYRGWTHTEIAERTGLPLGTVKSHSRRGLQRIRELLQQDGDRSGRRTES